MQVNIVVGTLVYIKFIPVVIPMEIRFDILMSFQEGNQVSLFNRRFSLYGCAIFESFFNKIFKFIG